MTHKCFISFKTEDKEYKNKIVNELSVDYIDKSLNEPINSTNEEYIMKKIRNENLSDSTVTIHLIGCNSAENAINQNQTYIKRELQASLYNGCSNTKNGILGVVLPQMYEKVFKGTTYCNICGKNHNLVDINDYTVVKEFSRNYYIPKKGCSWAEEDRYCVLVKWDEFYVNPQCYIEMAYQKRKLPISNKTTVRPK